MEKKSFSWGMIFALFVLFFPVGIWMLVKKVTDEKFNYLQNGKVLKIFGWVLFGIGIFYIIMGIAGQLTVEEGDSVVGGIIIMLVIFCGGGLFMVFQAKKFISRGAKFNRYVAIVHAGNDTLIDNIAAAYPTTYDSAVSDLQQMIDSGYFQKSYIDTNRKELVMPSSKPTASTPVNQKDPVKRTLKCPNCGATNTVTTGAEECEYCGSPL